MGLLQIHFLRNPSRKTSTNNINRRGQSCAVSIFFFFSRLWVRRVFPQEGKQTEEWTLNKTGSKMILNQRHLLFVGYRQDCMQYICSGGLLPGTSPASWNQSNTSRRKQLHRTDNKTMSGGSSSTKGSAGISGNHYSVRRRHQTPTGPPWNLNSTFDCGHNTLV